MNRSTNWPNVLDKKRSRMQGRAYVFPKPYAWLYATRNSQTGYKIRDNVTNQICLKTEVMDVANGKDVRILAP